LFGELHSCSAVVVVLAKPHNNLSSTLEDLTHELDLLIPFFDAILTNTDLIYPEGDSFVGISESMKSLYKSLCDRQTFPVARYVLRSSAISPCIRERIVRNLVCPGYEGIHQIDRDT
jgi:hypothetical protein